MGDGIGENNLDWREWGGPDPQDYLSLIVIAYNNARGCLFAYIPAASCLVAEFEFI